MDAGEQKAYLHMTVTRHLFAFLALLSGLAVLSHPVHAHLTEGARCDTSMEASAQAMADADHAPGLEASETTSKRELREPAENTAPLPDALRLPVLMGVERAYE
ncbi:MAG: hypothetical protein AAF707_07045 [Pseudomonadota bacterium]